MSRRPAVIQACQRCRHKRTKVKRQRNRRQAIIYCLFLFSFFESSDPRYRKTYIKIPLLTKEKVLKPKSHSEAIPEYLLIWLCTN